MPMQDYSVAERRYEILEQIKRQGRVSVTELSQVFGVSEVTIRADLQALAEQNLLVRTHGGAIPSNRLSPDLSLALRRQQQVLAKDHIGEAGAALVRDGDSDVYKRQLEQRRADCNIRRAANQSVVGHHAEGWEEGMHRAAHAHVEAVGLGEDLR